MIGKVRDSGRQCDKKTKVTPYILIMIEHKIGSILQFRFDLFTDWSFGWRSTLTNQQPDSENSRMTGGWLIFYHPAYWSSPSSAKARIRRRGVAELNKRYIHLQSRTTIGCVLRTDPFRSKLVPRFCFFRSKCRSGKHRFIFVNERTGERRKKKKRRRWLWSTFLDTTDMLARLESRGERRL